MVKTLEQKGLEVNILFGMCKFFSLSLTKRCYHKRNSFTTTYPLKLSADVNIFEMLKLFNFIIAEKAVSVMVSQQFLGVREIKPDKVISFLRRCQNYSQKWEILILRKIEHDMWSALKNLRKTLRISWWKMKSDAKSADLEDFEKITNDFDHCDIWGWFGDLSVIMW